MKHTKGPWFTEKVDASIGVYSMDEAAIQPAICFMDSGGWTGITKEEALANACLIAQAPSMAQLLAEIARSIRDGRGVKHSVYGDWYRETAEVLEAAGVRI